MFSISLREQLLWVSNCSNSLHTDVEDELSADDDTALATVGIGVAPPLVSSLTFSCMIACMQMCMHKADVSLLRSHLFIQFHSCYLQRYQYTGQSAGPLKWKLAHLRLGLYRAECNIASAHEQFLSEETDIMEERLGFPCKHIEDNEQFDDEDSDASTFYLV